MDSLRRRANARNVSFRISLRRLIYVVNSVDKTKLSCNTLLTAFIKVKVVEQLGVTLKRILQRSDPFRKNECNNINCLVCSTGGKGPCRSTGVTYELVCQPCRQKYIGETSRSAYTRGKEHPAASSGTEGAKFGDVETIDEFILGT